MNKSQFLDELAQKLSGLPQHEIDNSVAYYAEMIDDRTEDGMSEQDAVAALGNLDDIVREVMLDSPLTSLVKAKMKPQKKLEAWEIVLLVLGFPVWFSLLMAFISVIFSVYIAIWSVIVALFATLAGLVLGGIAGCIGSFFLLIASPSSALVGFGGSIACIGIGVLAFFPIKSISVWLVRLTGKFLRWVKSLFIKKEVLS